VPSCRALRNDAYARVIPALHPDIIVLANTESIYRFDLLQRTTVAALPSLRAPGRTLILVEPIVHSPPDPLPCLQEATFVEDCRYVADTRPSPVDQLYRRLAADDPTILSASLDRLACPYLPICDPIIGGRVVRWDGQHLATAYAATLGDELAAYLRATKLLPAAGG
jgi:hypothetical protein